MSLGFTQEPAVRPSAGRTGTGRPQPITHPTPHSFGLSALDPLLPLGQKLGRWEQAETIKDAPAFAKELTWTPAQSDTHSPSHRRVDSAQSHHLSSASSLHLGLAGKCISPVGTMHTSESGRCPPTSASAFDFSLPRPLWARGYYMLGYSPCVWMDRDPSLLPWKHCSRDMECSRATNNSSQTMEVPGRGVIGISFLKK